jgi:hypothetical protein
MVQHRCRNTIIIASFNRCSQGSSRSTTSRPAGSNSSLRNLDPHIRARLVELQYELLLAYPPPPSVKELDYCQLYFTCVQDRNHAFLLLQPLKDYKAIQNASLRNTYAWVRKVERII